MKYPNANIAAVVLSFLFVTGCFNLTELIQPPLEVHLYTLEYTSPAIKAGPQANFVIGIDEFTTAPNYATRDMIYKKKDFLVAEYIYHRWQIPPAKMVSYLLERDMRSAELFKGVYGCDNLTRTDVVVEGCVDKFLENDTTDDWQAELALHITLRDVTAATAADSILLQRQYEASQPCDRNHPRAFAGAMSLAMERLSAAIIEDVHTVLMVRE
ncbi:MAG: ABC-type transport auxiliary lipoprotein family protein [Thermodesulfobacteriota bacterium]|nr:ABC-type transport auxiliary lipoprotein family protein [Thermodesulfobacteriota bacterium]